MVLGNEALYFTVHKIVYRLLAVISRQVKQKIQTSYAYTL